MKSFSLFFATLCFATVAHAGTVKGRVFADANANGVFDPEECGISGVLVCNQRDFVRTDKDGFYEIAQLSDRLVYVVKPAAYSVTDYYCPAGTTVKDFALVPKQSKSTFDVLIVGDPQMDSGDNLAFFRDDIVTEMLHYTPEFSILLGDIANNDQSIYPDAKKIVSALPYTLYPVAGNHDINLRAVGTDSQADIFQRTWGPDYYAFNEGDVHFIVLNDVAYQGWDSADNKKGGYSPGITDRQFEWLVNDLATVPADHLIVLCMHIPFRELLSQPQQQQRLTALLQHHPHLLTLSGHQHTVEHYFLDADTGWNLPHSLRNITVGAACGGWWSGPEDERGLPSATCVDGAPNGFFKFTFTGNSYTYDFLPANHPADFQMRITVDGDNGSIGSSPAILYANIFVATPGAVVKAFLDDGSELQMQSVTARDPFMLTMYEQKFNYKGWVEETPHLWQVPLPELAKGIHRITVIATDVDGKQYVGYKLLEVL